MSRFLKIIHFLTLFFIIIPGVVFAGKYVDIEFES